MTTLAEDIASWDGKISDDEDDDDNKEINEVRRTVCKGGEPSRRNKRVDFYVANEKTALHLVAAIVATGVDDVIDYETRYTGEYTNSY